MPLSRFDLLITVTLAAAGNAAVVVVLCRAHAFAWLRRWVEGTLFGSMLACPLCTSCWTGLAASVIAGVWPWWLTIVCLTAAWYWIIVHAYSSEHA